MRDSGSLPLTVRPSEKILGQAGMPKGSHKSSLEENSLQHLTETINVVFTFSSIGPTIWNDLPVDIRSTDITREQFKRSLKSWLFECAYGRRRV